MTENRDKVTGEGNAPRGIAAAIDSHITALTRLVVVTKERDELLAACKRLCDSLRRNEILIPPDTLRILSETEFAIAKIERSKP
jgi:hypothetical protein